jgi:heat shock protein HtpX
MFEQIRANKRKSAVMVVLMAVVLFALGWFLAEAHHPGAGYVGLVGAGILWLIMTLVAHFSGDQIFLAMSGARQIEKRDLPVLWNIVEEMTIASGLGKMPKVYVIDDDAPNAFATGRSSKTASVAVTTGLLKLCNRDELQGVIAHEIGHVQNRDILLMLYAGVLVGSIALLAEVGLRSFWFGGGRRSRRSSEGGGQLQLIIIVVALVLMILAPIIAQLIYFAISRRREYLADASAAIYTRYPEGLASALEKLAAAPVKLAKANRVTAPMYIVNPLKRKGAMAANATATHPPISDRVKILRAMAGVSFAEYERTYRKLHGGRGVLPPSARMVEKQVQQRRSQAAEPAKERAREVDDFFYRQNDYRASQCDCGAKLKIPPGFLFPRINCPHCGKQHDLGMFATMTAGKGSGG